jgi:hypothetical protein
MRLRTARWWPVSQNAVLTGCAATFMMLLLVELISRMRFPWDLLIECESAFLTDMLKLSQGAPLFGPATDVNSSLYSPALEYVTYILLKPLGLQLDVRYCRLVTVLIGFAAAACAACVVARLTARDSDGRPRRLVSPLAFCVASLLLFKNFIADVPHPDNLAALDLMAMLLLCHTARTRTRLGPALAAAVLAGIGVLIKLELALAPVGVLLSLLVGTAWAPRQRVWIVVTALMAWFAAVTLLLWSENARFFVLHVALSRHLHAERVWSLAYHLVRGPYLVLAVVVVPCALQLYERRDAATRQLLLVWLCLGGAAVLPHFLAYVAGMGDYDMLSIGGVWAFVIVWPVLTEGRDAWRSVAGLLRFTVAVVLIATLVPVKLPPPAEAYRYGDQLERLVRADVAAGRTVLLAHGTMPLIRSGSTSIPRDRGAAMTALRSCGVTAPLRSSQDRIRRHAYDRIYSNALAYEWLMPMILESYRPVGNVPAANLFAYRNGALEAHPFGYQIVMPEVVILAPHATPADGRGPESEPQPLPKPLPGSSGGNESFRARARAEAQARGLAGKVSPSSHASSICGRGRHCRRAAAAICVNVHGAETHEG